MTHPGVPSTPVTAIPAGAVLLDVREDDEWAAGHAADALHVPLSQVPARLAELPEGEVAVVCKAGGRSAQAVAYLLQQGRTAVNVEGGMGAWAEAGLPMTAAPGVEPRVL